MLYLFVFNSHVVISHAFLTNLTVRLTVEKAQKDKGTNPLSAGCLLQPPTPILRGDNWPTLEVQKTTLEDLSAAQGGETEEAEYEDAVEQAPAATGGEWDMEDGFDDAPTAQAAKSLVPNADDDLDFGAGDGDWDDDLGDLGDLGDASARAADDVDLNVVEDSAGFQMPKAGKYADYGASIICHVVCIPHFNALSCVKRPTCPRCLV